MGYCTERNFTGIHSLPFTREQLFISTGHKSNAFQKFLKDRFGEANIIEFYRITDRLKTPREPDWRVLIGQDINTGKSIIMAQLRNHKNI